MARPIVSNNDGNSSNYPSEDSPINECDSYCYELQHARPYPYRCTFNDVLQHYKIRLKRAQMELTDRELIIALLKDQQARMENYCRSSLEETQNIKVKYNQLVQEMDSIRQEYEIKKNKSMNENKENLESYLRAELGSWKRENKEILGKIELMEFDVQRLLTLMSDRQNNNANNEIKYRLGKLDSVLENQSAILALLHSKVGEHSKAISYISRNVGSKMDEIIEKPNTSRDNLRAPENLRNNRTISNIQKMAKDAATNTETKNENINKTKNIEEQDTVTNKTEMIADFLEIAANEKKFFDEYGKQLKNPVTNSRSELSELDGHERIFRELPVNATSKTKAESYNYEGFNEFEHFESAMLADKESPNIIPSESVKLNEDEKIIEMSDGDPKPYIKNIPKCCTIQNENSAENHSNYEQAFQVVLFDGNYSDKLPICCEIRNEPMKIEKITKSESPSRNIVQTKSSSSSPDRNELLGNKAQRDEVNYKHAHNTNIPTYSSVSEEEIPRIWPTPLDETTSSSNEIEKASREGVVIEEVPINMQSSKFQNPSIHSEQDKTTKEELNKPTTHLNDSSRKIWNVVPKCCIISKTPERELLNEEISISKAPNKNFLQPEKSVDEIISDKLIIYGLETVPQPITEISIKIPYSEEQKPHVNENVIERHIDDARHEIESENKNSLLLGGQLHKVVNQLDDVLAATKQETLTLHSLKENFKGINEVWNQDFPIIKSTLELTNRTLGEMKNDVHNLKMDIERLLSDQEQNIYRSTLMNDSLKKQNEADSKKVLERVKSLEKHFCKCDSRTKQEKICHPSTGCSCKYRTIDSCKKMREEK